MKFILASLPDFLQNEHVLHSIHCHRNDFTISVSSGENFKQDGCPENKKVTGFFIPTISNKRVQTFY